MNFSDYLSIIIYASINLPITFAFIGLLFDSKSSGLMRLYMIGVLYLQYRVALWVLGDIF